MKLNPSEKIYLSESKIENAGKGIFAKVSIKKGDLIEKCPIVLIPQREIPHLRKTELANYYFMWGMDEKSHKGAICLGFGSLYNHSYSPNATYVKQVNEGFIDFVAIKDIEIDDEITVNYNYGNPDDKKTLWIKSIPPAN